MKWYEMIQSGYPTRGVREQMADCDLDITKVRVAELRANVIRHILFDSLIHIQFTSLDALDSKYSQYSFAD